MTLPLSRAAARASLVVLSFLCFQSFAAAQQQPATAVQPADAAFAAAKAAFEALAEAERKTIQDDLVWASTYTGTVDGGFGKGTFAAITAFEGKIKSTSDGILTAPERQALTDAARKARDEVGWKEYRDPGTSIVIDMPGKLLGLFKSRSNGMLISDAKSGLALALETYKTEETTLSALFDRMKADQPGRKVGYSVLKTDWFVLTSETGARRTYSRYVSTATGVAGFTFAYDASRADGERLAVAISNSFRQAGAAEVAATEQPTRKPVAVEEISGTTGKAMPAKVDAKVPAGGQSVDGATVAPPAAIKGLSAISALLVAPGRALTSERAADLCAQPSVAGKPVKVVAKTGGVGLLDVGDLKPTTGVKLAAGSSDGVQSTIVLFQAQQGAVRVLTAAAADFSGHSLVVSAAPGIAGAPVFDRSGALMGVLSGPSVEPLKVAGIVPEVTQAVAGSSAIAALLDSAGLRLDGPSGEAAMTAGALAQEVGKSVLAITCGK